MEKAMKTGTMLDRLLQLYVTEDTICMLSQEVCLQEH
jgi:hypothetical protein